MIVKTIDFYAQQPHYLDHLLPIWNLLPDERKGTFFIPPTFIHNDNFSMEEYANNKNCEVSVIDKKIYSPLIVVGGVSKRDIGESPLVLLNHGAGQSYIPHTSHSYAGGSNRDNVVLFLQPGETPAQMDKQRYPNATQAVIGCPKLDKWHQRMLMGDIKKRDSVPVIAISFHFDCRVCPETRSSWEYYKMSLSMLAYKNMDKIWKILGHGHPTIIEELIPYYKEYNIEIVKDFNEVMERADLYIVDHMSTLYEFASTGRPVVVLNAPWYRKNVEHGLRYWKYSDVGINVEHPNNLERSIRLALQDNLEHRMKRERAVAAVYKYRDGMCTERAVQAIINYLESLNQQQEQSNSDIINKQSNIKIENAMKQRQIWYNTR